MSKFENKVDFVVLVSVKNANSNGDPLNGNRPRTDYNGFGEISDVCIKRKIRNRMQDMGNEIFVKSDERADDGFICLKSRAECLSKIKSQEEFAKTACEKWLDVRSFGQVFAFKGFDCASVGVRGPVSIHQAVSVDPVEIESMQEGDTLTKIKAVIYCEKSSHKPIIIGKKGETIKRIGSYARADIEKLLGTQVFLELWVKVREDWRNHGSALKELGYTK